MKEKNDIVTVKLEVAPPPVDVDPMVCITTWNDKYMGICFNLMQAEMLFKSSYAHMILCIKVPICRFCTNMSEAFEFFMETKDVDDISHAP